MDNLRFKYEELCGILNIDKDTEENAWKQLTEVKQRFMLSDEIMHWYCCALYASCREFSTLTVGNALVMGNCVSLTELLRCCNISIYEFLSKIKKWLDMANLSEDFMKQIDTLERNFSLTYVVYLHYTSIFQDVFFVDKENMKFSLAVSKCSYQQLYDFTWCLFLCAKNECDNQLDLEKLFQLLVCCIDLIYKNVLYENRTDLINPKFKAVPEQLPSQEINSIVVELAAVVNIAAKDAKLFKATKWHNVLMHLFDSNNLFGNRETRLEIISNQNFERSWKSLNAAYEHYILGIGAFDERILQLPQSAVSMDFTTNSIFGNNDYLTIMPMSLEQQVIFLPHINTTVTDKLMKLLKVISAAQPIGVFCNVSESVRRKLYTKLHDMSIKIELNLKEKLHGNIVIELSRSLYFLLSEKIIRVEANNRPHISIDTFLDTDAFNTTLFACCVEIVLNSLNSDFKFPWVLDCFEIAGFEFFRVIELIVKRNHNILNHLHVEHLIDIENRCLESLAWCSTSKIWETIKRNGPTFPTWLDVDKNSLSIKDINSNWLTPTSVADPAFSVFFRKFYRLAWFRLEKLCQALNMDNDAYINKIWTIFEYSVTHCTHLLRGRHLDQLIMCAIYIYIRVTELNTILFMDIIEACKKQPQSVSTTYQEVLFNLPEDSNIPEYKHLKDFYNEIYKPEMNDYVHYFNKKSAVQLPITPHPNEKQSLPQKVFCNQNIFLSPMEDGHIKHSPNTVVYEIGKSPVKVLKTMNDAVRSSKRKLNFGDDIDENDSPKSRYVPKHLNSLTIVVKDRQESSVLT